MQLSSSVFGVCVVQIKPQLEALLGLPADALDKEMKLTQDLMELFIEYQVPSDLLSYNGHSGSAALEDKIANVKANVKAVMDVIESQKKKQLKDERAKADLAYERIRGGFTGWAGRSTGRSKKAAENRTRLGGFSGSMAGSAPPMTLGSAPVEDAFFLPESRGDLDMLGCVSVGCDGEDDLCFSYDADEVEEATSIDEGESPAGHEGAAGQSENKSPSNDIDGQGTASCRSDHGDSITQEGVDFTLIPKQLDQSVERNGEAASLRSTTIKAGSNWTRNRQANLLSKPTRHGLDADVIRKEKSKAFDLLDALSRSGSLAIAHSELHVVVAITHCFEKDLMGTVICDNVNPIEKLEGSTLLLASAVHGVSAGELVRDANELQRLRMTIPRLLEG